MARMSPSKQEREQHLEGLGLASPVLASKRPAAGEVDLGPVVLPDIDDPGTVEHPPPVPLGRPQWRRLGHGGTGVES